MNKHRVCCTVVMLTTLLASSAGSAIELKSAAHSAASAQSAYSSVSGVVSRIDGKSGWLILDGARRYEFAATALVVRRQDDASRPASVADIKVGSRVSLTTGRKTASSPLKVSEVWLVQ